MLVFVLVLVYIGKTTQRPVKLVSPTTISPIQIEASLTASYLQMLQIFVHIHLGV